MKQLILTMVILTAITFSLAAQKGKSSAFEGSISYNIEYLTELDAATKAQAPSEIIQFYKGNKVRIEQITPMGKVVVIADSDSKEQIVLLDLMGQKMALKTSKEETLEAMSDMTKPTINETSETKKIAGYTCKKIEVVFESSTETFWTTEEIEVNDPNWNQPWSNIKGLLMEYSQTQNDITSKIVAKEVKKSKVKDNMFAIPSDYQVMSMQEFRSMFGQ